MPDDDHQGRSGPGPVPPPPLGAPPAYPPGYPPPPGPEPTYQAPPPSVPPVSPRPAGTSPYGVPPGPPATGAPSGAPGPGLGRTARTRRRTVVTVLVVVVVVALVGAVAGVALSGGSGTTASSPASAPASPVARQLLRSSLAAARAVDAFHYVATSSVSGVNGSSQRTIGDAGPDRGRQDITIGTQKFTVLVIGAACYMEGNAPALIGQLGLSSSMAATHVGAWISLARTDAPYASVYAAVTAPSALADNITITPQVQLPSTTLGGRRVQMIGGAIAKLKIGGQTIAPKGTATLAVRAKAPHLPVRYSERSTQNGRPSRSSVSFSGWGETVDVTAPSVTVPYASLGGGSPVPSSPSGTVLT